MISVICLPSSWWMFQCVVSFLPCRAVRTGGLRWIWQAGCSQLTVRDMERPASQAPTPLIHCRWVVSDFLFFHLSACLCVFVGAGAFPKSQFIKFLCFQTDHIIIFDWCYVWVSLSLPRTHLRIVSFMTTPVRKDSPRYFSLFVLQYCSFCTFCQCCCQHILMPVLVGLCLKDGCLH